MSVIQVPKTAEERDALKKEVQKFLLDHGGDAKSRTVTLKHFMKERNLPQLFIKKAMGRIGLEDKKPKVGEAKKIAKEKLKLQKRVQKFLGSCDIIDSKAIEKLYDTLRKEGFKRRHIRTALFNVASILGKKYDADASHLLINLIKGSSEPSAENTASNSNAPIKGNKQSKIKNRANSNQINGQVKATNEKNAKNSENLRNVSFAGSIEATGRSGKKFPPTPAVKKPSPNVSSKIPSPGFQKQASKSPAPPLSVGPKGAESPANLNGSFLAPKSSVEKCKSDSAVTSQPTVGEVSKSPLDLNGSYLGLNSSGKKEKRDSAAASTSQSVKIEAPSQEKNTSVASHEEAKKTPAKPSILKADTPQNSGKKDKRRVSFGSLASPVVKTPLNSRQSMNLIDFNTPAESKGILDEECPALVPIGEASYFEKKSKSPKYSPRLTRSAARKKKTTN